MRWRRAQRALLRPGRWRAQVPRAQRRRKWPWQVPRDEKLEPLASGRQAAWQAVEVARAVAPLASLGSRWKAEAEEAWAHVAMVAAKHKFVTISLMFCEFGALCRSK